MLSLEKNRVIRELRDLTLQKAGEQQKIHTKMIRNTLDLESELGAMLEQIHPDSEFPSSRPGAPGLLSEDRSVPALTQFVKIDLGTDISRSGKRFRLNPTTAIYYPPGFKPGPYEIILYLHGHKSLYPGNTVWIDGYLDGKRFPFFALREAIQATQRNLIFVAPSLGPHSQAGALRKPGGVDRYIEQVAQAVNARFQKSLPAPERIYVSAHSGGGTPMLQIAQLKDQYVQKIMEYWGFDSLYGGVSQWRQWATENPNKRLYVYYLRSTAAYARSLQSYRLPNVSVKQSGRGHFWVPVLHLKERIDGIRADAQNTLPSTGGRLMPSKTNTIDAAQNALSSKEFEFEASSQQPIPPLDKRSRFHTSRLTPAGDSDFTTFKKKVYEAHVRGAMSKRSFISDQQSSDIEPWLEKRDLTFSEKNGKRFYHPVSFHARMTEPIKNLLTAARKDAAGAGKRIEIYLRSGYRSASDQFRSWDNKFGAYYEQALRGNKINRGDYGEKAVQTLAAFIGARLAAPGYSNHQHGRAVDFGLLEEAGGKPKWHLPDTSPGSVAAWRDTWFWKWLNQNAQVHGFTPYTAEPWHWEVKNGNLQNGQTAKPPQKTGGHTDHQFEQRIRVLWPHLLKHKGEFPLNFLVGWIKVESGGNIKSHTKLDERGYFQVHPDESKGLGLDHARLSADPEYSIKAGIEMVKKRAKQADAQRKKLGVPYLGEIHLALTKLRHWLPLGVDVIIDKMNIDGYRPATWADFKKFVELHNNAIKAEITRRDRKKRVWNPLRGIENTDKVFLAAQEFKNLVL